MHVHCITKPNSSQVEGLNVGFEKVRSALKGTKLMLHKGHFKFPFTVMWKRKVDEEVQVLN